jgi:hypothetical protein
MDVAAGELSWKKLVSPRGSASARTPGPVVSNPGAVGHHLGKRLLVELHLISDPTAPAEDAADDEDFHWESSETWNAL